MNLYKSGIITLILLFILAVANQIITNVVSDLNRDVEITLLETTAAASEDTTALQTGEQSLVNIANDSAPSDASTADALLIGDSRALGLAEHANLNNTDFFATMGMTVYKAREVCISIPNIGKVTLDELLNGKEYDTIYVMLGLNELSRDFDQTLNCYRNLLTYVQQIQPQAVIILMANIHVTEARSKSDPYFNNPAINRFNEAIAQLANQETVCYLDANGLFDDGNGNLAEEKSADNAHPSANSYTEWGDWLTMEVSRILAQ